MIEEPDVGGPLGAAIQRLDRALTQIERRVGALEAQAETANGELFEQDRAQLAADLDAARSRERDLEAAGQQASLALGRAIAEIRAALSDEAADEDGAPAPTQSDVHADAEG